MFSFAKPPSARLVLVWRIFRAQVPLTSTLRFCSLRAPRHELHVRDRKIAKLRRPALLFGLPFALPITASPALPDSTSSRTC